MATAEDREQRVITLELDEKEAAALEILLAQVGGLYEGPREYLDRIEVALEALDLDGLSLFADYGASGGVSFRKLGAVR